MLLDEMILLDPHLGNVLVEWVDRFMNGRMGRIANELPYAEVDFVTLLAEVEGA